MTGAPGSTWSGIAKRIYWSPDIDHSDYSEDREYWGDNEYPAHFGAYWDPGMEFIYNEWDAPFSGQGVRLIKSHTLALYLRNIKYHYKDPIVLVYRDNDKCFDWWKQAGGWDITYPYYGSYYKNDEEMKRRINEQNESIHQFVTDNWARCTQVKNLRDLNKVLDIAPCPEYNPRYPDERLFDAEDHWVADDVRIWIFK